MKLLTDEDPDIRPEAKELKRHSLLEKFQKFVEDSQYETDDVDEEKGNKDEDRCEEKKKQVQEKEVEVIGEKETNADAFIFDCGGQNFL